MPTFMKGDVPGHEFHGNQYTDGGGSDGSKTPEAKVGDIVRFSVPHPTQGTTTRSGPIKRVGPDTDNKPHLSAGQFEVKSTQGGYHVLTRDKFQTREQWDTKKADEPESVEKGDKPGHEFRGSQHLPTPSEKSQVHHTVDCLGPGCYKVKKKLHLKDHAGQTSRVLDMGHGYNTHETQESAQAEASRLNASLKGR